MARFAAAIAQALGTETVRERLLRAGAVPAGGTPDDARRFHLAELPKWKGVVRISGARVD